MAMTDTQIRNAKPAEKPYKLTDARGLYLLVTPRGGRWWRFDYRFAGKRKTLSLGTYPDVPLKHARDRLDEARRLVGNGVDPGDARKAQKAAETAAESFKAVALEWVDNFSAKWTDSHTHQIIRRLEKDIFPWLGRRPIREITAPELLALLRRIESRGAIETAYRAKMSCGQIFRYAVATGRAERDPSADLRGALPHRKVKHRPTLTDPKPIGGLLRAIENYDGYFVVKSALRFAPLVFVRPGELRHAEWSEIDLNQAEWRIPGHKMKMREQHIVPLAQQAVVVLRELYPLTGRGKYLFPSVRTVSRPISENTINAALRRMGYTTDEMCGHGFRGMASTMLHEMGFQPDWIERQLAHAERNSVRAAYNHAQHLPERRQMMQSWADFLGRLREGADVTPLHSKHAR